MGARPFRALDAFLQEPPALRLRLRLGCREERRVRAFLLWAFLAHPAGTYEHSIERLMLVSAFFSYDAPLYREEDGESSWKQRGFWLALSSRASSVDYPVPGALPGSLRMKSR